MARTLRSDHAGIESAIEEIDYAFNAILAAQSKNGARINRFETTLVRNENQFTETTALQSELDAEMAETISKFLLTENIYNAASRLHQADTASLVNYLS